MQPMRLMLDLIADAGMAAVRAKSVLLTERAVARSDALLSSVGVRVASPRDQDRRGSHVTVEHPRFREVCAELWRRGVIPDFRPPDGIRIGLSPLSTTFAELDLGMEAISTVLGELS